LQLAQDTKAKAAVEEAIRAFRSGASSPLTPTGNNTAFAAMQARLVLETADWKGAAALPVYESPFPAVNSLNRFARGLGMARSGDVASAKGEIEAIKPLRAALEKVGDS